MTQPTQEYCPNIGDHPAHDGMRVQHAGGSRLRMIRVRCPGRWTPSLHGGISGEPAHPSDPFAGLDSTEE